MPLHPDRVTPNVVALMIVLGLLSCRGRGAAWTVPVVRASSTFVFDDGPDDGTLRRLVCAPRDAFTGVAFGAVSPEAEAPRVFGIECRSQRRSRGAETRPAPTWIVAASDAGAEGGRVRCPEGEMILGLHTTQVVSRQAPAFTVCLRCGAVPRWLEACRSDAGTTRCLELRAAPLPPPEDASARVGGVQRFEFSDELVTTSRFPRDPDCACLGRVAHGLATDPAANVLRLVCSVPLSRRE